MYAIHNLRGRALQVNTLLKAEGSKVLGVLVQHLSVENFIAIFDHLAVSEGPVFQ